MTDTPFDVGIVGYGPVGAALANLVGVAGLSAVVFEREAAPYDLPRAVHFDDEVMRVFETAGLAEAIAPRLFVNRGMRFVTADGATLIDWPRPQGIGPHGWRASYRFHQPDLEAALRAGVSRYPGHRVLTGEEVVGVIETSEGVTVESRPTAGGEVRRADCRYLVGCDGARSLVRRWIGATMEDLKSDQQWLVVDVLMERERSDLSDWTVQYCDPRRPATVARGVGRRRRWEFMVMPGDDPARMTDEDRIWRLLAPWIGPDEATIERAAVYRFHAVLARGWRRGRLLLAGDAAHQTPPFLGQGLCAGIRDAANLAWKLAAVVKGRADEILLDSYEAERRPHAADFVALAVRLGDVLQSTDPEAASARDRDMADNPVQLQSIAPRLGPGLHGDAPAPAGALFPQPLLPDGRRLDALTGYGFALVADAGLAADLAPSMREALGAAGVALVTEGGGEALAEMGTRAALVRPDRYVLGVAADAAALQGLIDRLPVRPAVAD